MTILYTYLTLGFIYAMYIWLFAGDPWWSIPVNTVGGPFIFLREVVRGYVRKKLSPSKMFASKKAVIFDLDGTIIDSQPFRNQAMDNMLKTIGGGWVTRTYSHGLNAVERWEYILHQEPEINTEFTVEELAEHTKTEYLKLYTEVEAIPGFWDFMHYLKNVKKVKVGLATNADRNVADAMLKRLGASEIFDFVIAGDEVKHRKPSPEIYKTAAKKMGLKPKDILVFEDTIVGSTAAHKAGMDTIVIWDGEDEEMEDYPKGIYEFAPDFVEMGETLEKEYVQRLEEGVAMMKESGEA